MNIETISRNTNATDPLVSIVVVTYNASKYVLETLESAKAQTYMNIELIISDDSSKDDTVEICRNWVEENKSRFVRVQLITSEINTGIPGNCNRGYRAAEGAWIKGIGGDDILMNRCIELNMGHVEEGCKVLFSNMQTFIVENGERKLLNILPKNDDLKFFELNAHDQYSFFLDKSFLIAPTGFIERDVFIKVGGFDERFICFEDLPFYLALTKSGYKFSHFNQITVLYRKGEGVTSQNKTLLHPKLRRSVLDFERIILFKAIPWYNISFFVGYFYNLIDYYLAFYLFKNKRSRFAFFVLNFVKHTNPVRILQSSYFRLLKVFLFIKEAILSRFKFSINQIISK